MFEKDTPKPRKIQARSLRAAIRKAYPSIVAFARVHGVTRRLIYLVINGTGISSPIAQEIALLYGQPPHVIWPGKYGEDGKALGEFPYRFPKSAA